MWDATHGVIRLVTLVRHPTLQSLCYQNMVLGNKPLSETFIALINKKGWLMLLFFFSISNKWWQIYITVRAAKDPLNVSRRIDSSTRCNMAGGISETLLSCVSMHNEIATGLFQFAMTFQDCLGGGHIFFKLWLLWDCFPNTFLFLCQLGGYENLINQN
jgi:hypothetical protein